MIGIDNQPISATFFGEGKWLTDFITPEALEIQELYKGLTRDLTGLEDKLVACQRWVAQEVKYVSFVRGKLQIAGRTSIQNDLWNPPSITAKVRVGNCLGEGTKILVEKDRRFHIKKIEELANYNGYSAVSYNFTTLNPENSDALPFIRYSSRFGTPSPILFALRYMLFR